MASMNDTFLKIDGIDGDSTDSKHTKWIEISSYSLNAHQATGGSSSAHGALAGGKVEFTDFSISKKLDSASPLLFLYCCNGKSIPNINLELCRATGEKTCYMKYVFKDSIVSSFSPSGTSGPDAVPVEQISFRFSELHCIYTPTNEKGTTGPAVKKGWSALKNLEVAP